jgi:hypothetical protein
MSHIVASSAPIAAAHTVKRYPGFGILGADIPDDGDNGPSPILNDSPVSTAEYHWRVETAPSAGELTIYPDLTFEWDSSGAADGAYPWVYRLFENGVSQGTATVAQQVGSPVGAFAATLDVITFAGGASVSPRAAFSLTTDDAIVVAGARVSPSAAFGLTTDEAVFAGGGSVAGAPASGGFAITTDAITFAGGASVSPAGAFSVSLADAAFVGGASVGNISEGAYALTLDSVAFSGGATGYIPAGLTLSPEDIAAIAAAVIAALRAANPPVPVECDAPTPTEIATAVWGNTLP